MNEQNESALKELLHRILGSYIEDHKSIMPLFTEQERKHITMEMVLRALNITGITPGLAKSWLMTDDLLMENPGTSDGEPLIVTPKGRPFWKENGYNKKQIETEQAIRKTALDQKVAEGTIKNFKYGRWGFWLSVVNILLFILFKVTDYLENQERISTEQRLTVQLNKLSEEVFLQKITVDSLAVELSQADLDRKHAKTLSD